MISNKQIILENISMKEILNEYNIKTIRDMFYCPFHNDKSPSAKMYSNSYYCFACGKWGDTIQFVEDYFNLNFVEAIKKINYDFNLNLNCGKLSKEQIGEIEERKKQKEEKKQEHYDKLLIICKTLKILEQTKKDLKSEITPYNWEDLEYKCSILTNEIELLNEEFDELNVKTY